MCLPHLHPFWVNQKKKTKRKRSAGKKCAIHSKVKAGEASCVPTLRIALMRAVHGRKSCFRKRSSNFWARKGREGTWDQSACSPAKAFLRDPARAFSFWPRDIPKALFLYHEYVPVGWWDCHHFFNFIVEENTDFQRESRSLLFPSKVKTPAVTSPHNHLLTFLPEYLCQLFPQQNTS